MKLLLAAVSVLCFSALAAQHDFPNCQTTYFKNGTVSTTQCYDKNNRFGKARAFNLKGEKIYERELRKAGGHSTVSFTFYKNGAVQKAEWRSAPDGGIQWYSNVTAFAEDGTLLSSVDRNYDDGVTVPLKHTPNPESPVTKTGDTANMKQETLTGAVIYENEFWYINHSGQKLIITAVRNRNEFFTALVSKEGSVKGGSFILAQQFDTPDKYFSFSVQPLNNKAKQKFTVSLLPELTNTVKEGLRRYYYEIK